MKKKEIRQKRVKKNHLGRIIVLFFSAYLLYYLIVFILNLPIKNIEIIGNKLVSDHEIIMMAGIRDYPPLLKVNSNKIINKINKIDLIESSRIVKNLNGKLSIIVKEAKPLFIDKIENKIVLNNKKKIIRNDIIGIPVLINFVPNIIFDQFVLKFSDVNSNIIANINYMEYKPSYSESGDLIDETRFILYMNDGNIIYTNPSKIINLNYYLEILSSLENKKYILYLDSGNYDNFVFIPQK